MKVLKFGGLSLGNTQGFNCVFEIIKQNGAKDLAVIVSAIGETTNQLQEAGEKALAKDESYLDIVRKVEKNHFEIIREIVPIAFQSSVLSGTKMRFNKIENLLEGVYLLEEFSEKTQDQLLAFGELTSAFIMTKFLQIKELNAVYIESRDLIKTVAYNGAHQVKFEETEALITNAFQKNKQDIMVMAGFVASDKNNVTTTLGRGGSDYTAALVASAINAEELQLCINVNGFYATHPEMVKEAKVIQEMSYQEAMEMSHFGSWVIYPPTIQPVFNKQIPIRIKNTFDYQHEGTLIHQNAKQSDTIIRGISHLDHVAFASLEGRGMIGVSGVSQRLFSALSSKNINVILITQASSEQSICVAIKQESVTDAKEVVNAEFQYERELQLIDDLKVDENLSILAMVGDGMQSHFGIGGKMFSALGDSKVNIKAIAQGASERNISTVINSNDVEVALNALHKAFFE